MKKNTFKINEIAKSSTIQSISAMFFVSIASSIIGALLTFLQGIYVSPENLGYFNQFTIVGSYLFFLHLGTFHAIEKIYPESIGKGDNKTANDFINTGYSWILVVTIFLSVILLIFSIHSFIIGNWKAGLGWLSQSLLIVITLYGGFLGAVYRSTHNFKELSKTNLYGPLLSLLAIPFFWIQSYLSLFIKHTSQMISVISQHIKKPIRFNFKINFSNFKILLKKGFPRFTASYVSTTGLIALRTSLILIYLGTSNLGLWVFSWSVFSLVLKFPQSIVGVISPQIIQEFGKTNDLNKALKISKKPLYYGVLASIIVLPIAIILTYKIFPVILPLYSEATWVIIILLISMPFKMIDTPAVILNAMDRIRTINIIAIISSLFQVIVIILGFTLDWGLIGVSIAYTVGNLLRMIMLTYAIIKLPGYIKE